MPIKKTATPPRIDSLIFIIIPLVEMGQLRRIPGFGISFAEINIELEAPWYHDTSSYARAQSAGWLRLSVLWRGAAENVGKEPQRRVSLWLPLPYPQDYTRKPISTRMPERVIFGTMWRSIGTAKTVRNSWWVWRGFWWNGLLVLVVWWSLVVLT